MPAREDNYARIGDLALGVDDRTILAIRSAGSVGYPGGVEVVNMCPLAALIRANVEALPCISDGQQSGTSGSQSILNASPEGSFGFGYDRHENVSYRPTTGCNIGALCLILILIALYATWW